MYGCASGKMHGGNQEAEWMEVIERSTGTAVIHWFGVLYVRVLVDLYLLCGDRSLVVMFVL